MFYTYEFSNSDTSSDLPVMTNLGNGRIRPGI